MLQVWKDTDTGDFYAYQSERHLPWLSNPAREVSDGSTTPKTTYLIRQLGRAKSIVEFPEDVEKIS